MFERFTDPARDVIVLAQEDAKSLNHNYIGTEHLLLALTREGKGVAAKTLESLGISYDGVLEQILNIIGLSEQRPGHIPFTPRAKKVLDLSLREALQLGHNSLDTEHILLGLIREGEGAAVEVLKRLGVDPDRVRQKVLQLLAGYDPASEQQPPAAVDAPAKLMEPLNVSLDILDDGRLVTVFVGEGYEFIGITAVLRGPDGRIAVQTKEFEQ